MWLQNKLKYMNIHIKIINLESKQQFLRYTFKFFNFSRDMYVNKGPKCIKSINIELVYEKKFRGRIPPNPLKEVWAKPPMSSNPGNALGKMTTVEVGG